MVMAHRVLGWMSLALLAGCDPRPKPPGPAHPVSARVIDSCPVLSMADTAAATLAAIAPDTSAFLDKLRRQSRYLSMLIDNQRELWNQDLDTWASELAPGLDPSDIESLTIWRPGAAPASYHVCPGVSLITVVTKSKTYHPVRSAGP